MSRVALWISALFAIFSCASDVDRNTAMMTSEAAAAHFICFGNSITAAFGIDPHQGFPTLLQQKIDSAGLAYRVLNAGISGETTQGGDERVHWVLRDPPTFFLLELGLNDLLMGVSPGSVEQSLQSIIKKVNQAAPEAVIFLLPPGHPPGMPADRVQAFAAVYERLARSESVILLPDMLTALWTDRRLVLPDGLHPNAAGQTRLAEALWSELAPRLI